MIKNVHVYEESRAGPGARNCCCYLSVLTHLQASNDSQGRVKAAPGQGTIVPEMPHYLSWDVFLRHAPLVPHPLQASALIKHLLGGHSMRQPSLRNPEKEKPRPIICLKWGGRRLCLPLMRRRQVGGPMPWLPVNRQSPQPSSPSPRRGGMRKSSEKRKARKE